MTDAYASNGGSAGIASFLPLIILGIIYGIVLKFIAKRLGKNEWLWFLIGLIPLVNGIAGLWLMYTAYNYIMDKLEFLEKSINRTGNN
ncbi:hypothetical protein HZB60_06250 [candidate division KSB1 bacterium]|nr:hypothetical protein [candidate division KSB1 bacterium]